MKVLELYQRIGEINKSNRDKQAKISVSEVWHLYNHLTMRYNVLETTNILRNYARSKDLKELLDFGANVLQTQIKKLETIMKEYGVPLPIRPAYDSKSLVLVEAITERYIFRRIFRGIQSFIPYHSFAFIHSTSPKLREEFRTFLLAELDIYDKFIEYGKLRGFELVPPMYAK